MKTIYSPTEMADWSAVMRRRGKSIALVPTMGFFHDGHLSLMRLAAEKAELVVVSLFVNPIQFGPQEDLSRYPRDFDRDADLAKEQGVTVLFAPDAAAMYPEGFQTAVSVDNLTVGLCGANRPGHFKGVTTVVAKLFNIVQPDVAVFGEKDFQQLTVIRRMVRDLAWNIELIGHSVVREPDGLAMSSRNSYLSKNERKQALCLYRGLQTARQLAEAGEREAATVVEKIRQVIDSCAGVEIEYIKLVDSDELAEQTVVDSKTRLVMAVRIGKTRLIDNGLLL